MNAFKYAIGEALHATPIFILWLSCRYRTLYVRSARVLSTFERLQSDYRKKQRISFK